MNLKEEKSNSVGNYIYTDNELTTCNSPYTKENNPYETRQNQKITVEKIEALIKALGTMVLIPEAKTNPTTFQKEWITTPQQPILMNEDRVLALNKLTQLVNSL